MLDISKLRMYSIAYVSEDIKEDSLYLKAYPVEILSDETGTLGDQLTEKVSNIDVDGNVTTLIYNKDYLITAKWFNFLTPNRLTPPNICAGETVMLWRYDNTDKYFWTNVYNELDLRKLEKATFVFSNKRKIGNKNLLNQLYSFTVDTINKYVKLHTDDGDGELTTYDIEIDTDKGVLTIVDGRGNLIELDSEADKVTITTNKEVVINTPKTTINSADVTFNSTNMTMNTTNLNINAATQNIKAGSTKYTGGTITHDDIAIDNTHSHTGNLGVPVSKPN